jgi:pimeloyl-ACP methyl ester carboxylesterase
MSPKPSVDYGVLDRPEVLKFLFHPRKVPGPVENDGRFEEVMVPVTDDIRIGARFHMVQQTGPTLLFFHGNGEIVADYDDIAALFNRLNVNFMVVDYRGYGCSEGSPTVTAMMSDCHRIFDFTERWKADNGFSGPAIVMGRSLGSASALELAATRGDRIDGLVIESGFAWAGPLLKLLGVRPEKIGFEEAAGFSNVEKIRAYTKPTRIIHAEFDHIIPFTDGRDLYEASAASDKVLVKISGANHNDIFFRGMDLYLETIDGLARSLM